MLMLKLQKEKIKNWIKVSEYKSFKHVLTNILPIYKISIY